MDPLIASIAAAVGLAFGITALTTVSVRSEENARLVAFTFGSAIVILLAMFLWADLPPDVMMAMAGIGVLIGLVSVMILQTARHVERRTGANRP